MVLVLGLNEMVLVLGLDETVHVLGLDAVSSSTSTSTANAEYEYKKCWENMCWISERLENRNFEMPMSERESRVSPANRLRRDVREHSVR